MWKINESNVRDLTFRDMNPEEVLYDFDGPRIFTFKAQSELYFACLSDEDSQNKISRFLVVPTTQTEINRLKNGASTIIHILNHRFLWIVDRNFNDEVVCARSMIGGISAVPEGFKPEKDAMLWEHLQPEKAHRQFSTLFLEHLASKRSHQQTEINAQASHGQPPPSERASNFYTLIINRYQKTTLLNHSEVSNRKHIFNENFSDLYSLQSTASVVNDGLATHPFLDYNRRQAQVKHKAAH